MKYYLTGKQAQIIDNYTQDIIGIPGLVLMEKAAEKLADEIDKIVRIANNDADVDTNISSDSGIYTNSEKELCKLKGFRKDRDKILSVVEGGNNGGDAIAAARILKTKGYDTYIYEINGISKKSESYIKQVEIAKNLGVKFVEPGFFGDFRIIIDGIFGVGLTRPVGGIQKSVIEAVNDEAASGDSLYVVGCDIASGISSANGHILGTALKCDMTVTFEYIKYGMLVNEGREYSGRIICDEIGLYHPESISEMNEILNLSFNKTDDQVDSKSDDAFLFYEYESAEVQKYIPSRKADSNKGSYGKVLIVAGSSDVYGAALLSAEACYRTGAGLVKIVTDQRNRDVMCDKLPEAMMLTYDSDTLDSGDLAGVFKNDFKMSIKWADIVLIGPGIGTNSVSKMLIDTILDECKEGQNIVLDADAINIISENDPSEYLGRLARKIISGRVVITPHIQEMVRLINGINAKKSDDLKGDCLIGSISYVKENRACVSVSISEKENVITVLKDDRTFVSDPDAKESLSTVYINTTGNSGMSTGGSGDILAGIIAGLLSQNKDSKLSGYDIVCAAVNLHGTAGDNARKALSERTMIARDIINGILL